MTAITKKTFYDLASLIEVLEEIRDENDGANELTVVTLGGKPLTEASMVGNSATAKWVQLR